MEDYDVIVVGDEDDFAAPKSCEIDGAKFKYLGVFPHWRGSILTVYHEEEINIIVN